MENNQPKKYRLVNIRRPEKKPIRKTETWIRKFAHILPNHGLKVDDTQEVSTEFHLFLKQKELVLNIGPPPVAPEPEKKGAVMNKPTEEILKQMEEAKSAPPPPPDYVPPMETIEEAAAEKEDVDTPKQPDMMPKEWVIKEVEKLKGMKYDDLIMYARGNNIKLKEKKKAGILKEIINHLQTNDNGAE